VSTVQSPEAIENMLRHGLTPLTANRDALVCLGFSRAYERATGYDATIWERAVDHGRRASDGSRMLVRQRAILVPACARLDHDR
jgi:hypothetical protein